jgi:hypothetical protein
MIKRSTPQNEEIRRTTEDTATTENNTQIRRKGDPSDAPTTQRSGVKSNAEKWCEIHRTDGHDLKECKTFVDHKKMSPPAVPAPQDPRRGEHRWEVSDGDEHMVEINMIFGGSMSITFKTQGKKVQCKIRLAHQIEPGR